MPTRDEILRFMTEQLARLVKTPADIWAALYLLLLDYSNDVPRITDSNRLKPGTIWHNRAKMVEQTLADATGYPQADLINNVDVFMRSVYPPGTQRMNPVGIALACATVYLIDRFAVGNYRWRMEAKIGRDIFPDLTGFRRSAVDIVAFKDDRPFAVISSKWGIRHDRVRDPQEEADTYKHHQPDLKFYVLTNEFDNGRLQHVLTYPTIDGVFHINKNLVWQVYGGNPMALASLKDFTDLFALFP
jgi:hypothetical protein